MDETIYRENILDHYHNPRNFGKLAGANAKAKDDNPLCGDEIEIRMKIAKGRIAGIKFSGHGCAICTASASMLTERIKGKKVDEALAVEKESVLSLVGVPLSAVRVKCALLSLKVLKTALYSFKGAKMKEEG